MLFDLRGRGRRRAVKIIYLGLAILLGGGLVFFGVGGNVQGGLFDAFQAAGRGRGGTLPRRLGHSTRVNLRPGWPARGLPGLLPLARVDYIWHTADLAPLDCWVGEDAGSDHLPVLAELTLSG